MRGIWAMARHTFAQCLRMKVATLFIVLLALALVVIPATAKGDGTLTGRIQTLLAYSVSATVMLLGLVTIFLGVSVVTDDIHDKQIFSVATKPLARWQYIVGRWLGVVMLDALLLTLAGLGIYAAAEHLRGFPAMNEVDRRRVETEVFTARRSVAPLTENLDRQVAQRLEQVETSPTYSATLDEYRSRSGGDTEIARKLLAEEIHKQVYEQAQSAAPGRQLSWVFNEVRVQGKETSGRGTVKQLVSHANRVWFQVPAPLIGRLVYQGPILVDGVEGRVVGITQEGGEHLFAVTFDQEKMTQTNLAALHTGQNVTLTFMTTIQLTYKPEPGAPVAGNVLHCVWEIENSATGYLYRFPRQVPPNLPDTLTIPASVIQPDGSVHARYINMFSPDGAGVSVTILNSNVSVLYRVGDFSSNFVRGMALVLLQLVFLAAVAVLTGSFLSFPVACLMNFGLFPFYFMRSFLVGSFATDGFAFFNLTSEYILKVTNWLLPDLAALWPSDSLVDGMNIAWGYVGLLAATTVGIQCLAAMTLACVIFSKRELAKVQV